MPKITIEITGWTKKSGRDYGIIEPYRRASGHVLRNGNYPADNVGANTRKGCKRDTGLENVTDLN